MNDSLNTIPVTVIGGYLGAGKTTLVNHLLRNAGGLRMAVLVNEFGDLPIDSDLITAREDDVISLAGGCICCSYGSDLMATLLELPGRVPRPEHILIEASGVALPGAIASSVCLVADYELDAVIVLADAVRVREQAADRYLTDTIERQLAEADLVLLNKVDQLSPSGCEELRQWVAKRSPGAEVLPVVRASVPLGMVIGSKLHREPLREHPKVHARFHAISFLPPPLTDPGALAKALAAPSLGLARAKGIVQDSAGARYVLHVVGNSWLLQPAAAGLTPGGVVCIGVRERVDVVKLQALVEAVGASSVGLTEGNTQ